MADSGKKTYGEIISVFKSLESFRYSLEKQGHVLPELSDLFWDYVLAIASGKKILLKKTDLANFVIPFRFNNQT